MPTYGAYAGAKFALEAVSDSLPSGVMRAGAERISRDPDAFPAAARAARRGAAREIILASLAAARVRGRRA